MPDDGKCTYIVDHIGRDGAAVGFIPRVRLANVRRAQSVQHRHQSLVLLQMQ